MTEQPQGKGLSAAFIELMKTLQVSIKHDKAEWGFKFLVLVGYIFLVFFGKIKTNELNFILFAFLFLAYNTIGSFLIKKS